MAIGGEMDGDGKFGVTDGHGGYSIDRHEQVTDFTGVMAGDGGYLCNKLW